MRDRQISLRRLAYELPILTTTVYQIISNYSGMKKASIRSIPKLLKSIQSANRLDYCQEPLQESEVNSNNNFHRIVTDNETCLYYDNPLSEQEAKVG